MCPDKIIFTSYLCELLDGYVKEQRSVGYKYAKGASLLKMLDSHLERNPLTERRLPKESVLSWTAKKPKETDSTRNGRISAVRGFARYMVRLGYKAYIYPPSAVKISRYSYVPYIFTEGEIRNIFASIDNYPVCDVSPYRHLVLKLLMRMLYGCGLRISEALNLRRADVDLENGILFIRDAKFGKERLVPMAETLTERCRQYSCEVHTSDYFFPSPHGGRYKESTIYQLFRDLLWKAGISHSGRGPRLHDLRHAHAVHRLKNWVLKGKDLTQLLPYLSTYLGHVDLRGTQRYLRLTADLYPTITAAVEKHFSSLIPEVESHETD